MSTVLVTGGGGFLGRHLVAALLAGGERVHVLARGAYPELEGAGARCFRGDVQDKAAVSEAMQAVDTVFHVAARVGYWGPLEDFRAVNVSGTRQVLACARAAGVRSFVYTSSPSVVLGPGSNVEGGDESLPYVRSPSYAYGATKAEAEALVLAAHGAMATCALRPHFIFGPGDPHIVPRLVERARRGRLLRVGDGTNKVDVTFIENAVSAHLCAARALEAEPHHAGGQAYFIGDGEPVSLWTFVGQVLQGLDAPPVVRSVSYPVAFGLGASLEAVYRGLRLRGEPAMTRMAATILGKSHTFSHAKAARILGYRPAVSTADGLERLFASQSKALGPLA